MAYTLLSRGDVPSKEELIYIKNEFPKDFPKQLLLKYWEKLLKH